jgi:hypothetical protein
VQKNKIKFIYHNDLAYEMGVHPQPAKNYLPEWYKQMPPYQPSVENPNGRSIKIRDGHSNATAKKCVPMLDGIGAGYIVPLWCDVQVEIRSGEPEIFWRISSNVFVPHGEATRDIPAPFGYFARVFKFCTYFRIETPRGFSISVQPPAGHYQLPFRVIPAVIDSDRSVIDNNFPCWVQDGFEGIVEKGTPIAQVVPFKRTNWKAEMSVIPYEEHRKFSERGFESNILNNYVRNIWRKKTYE